MIKNKVVFGIMDEQAKENSNPTATQTNYVSTALSLKDNNSSVPKIVTFEDDYWVLDGSQPFYIPSETAQKENGWWSEKISRDDGYFDTNPELDILFDTKASSIGLTFIFESNNVISDFKIDWYNDGAPIGTHQVSGNIDAMCIVEKVVTEYDRLHITIQKTSVGRRFAKIARIDYGIGRELIGDEIVSAEATFSTDLISKEIPVSTFKLQIYNEEAEFSILNPTGVYLALKEKQKFDIYRDNVLFARFYLREWESIDNYNYTFICDDIIGVMDSITFMGGMYVNYPAKQLIIDIVNKAGFDVTFEDTDIETETVSGWIGVVSCRAALHQVLFAICRVVSTTAGADMVNVHRVSSNTDKKVIDDMYMGEKLVLRDPVSSIEITTHEYAIRDEIQEVCSVDVNAGDTKVLFSSPYSDYSVSSGQILESNCNYLIIRSDTQASIKISAKPYIDSTKTVSRIINQGTKENVRSVEGATLVGSHNVDRVMDNIEWYYSLRVERNFSYDYENRGVCGDSVLVNNVFKYKNNCVIESLDVNLVTDIAYIQTVVDDE